MDKANIIYRFFRFLSNDEFLSKNQRLKRDQLIARSYSKKDDLFSSNETEINSSSKPFKQKDPKETAKFLSLFNKPEGFKYLTHDFDVDQQPNNINDLIEQVKKLFKKYKNLPLSLWSLFNSFLNGGEKGWIDTFREKHYNYLSDPKWINWSNKNNLHPIKNSEFAQEIGCFRSTIRVDKGLLEKIIKNISDKNDYQFDLNYKNIKSADFYTNTFILYKAIEKVLDIINKDYCKKDKNEVEISYLRDKDENSGYMLRKIIILHKKSFALKKIDDAINKLQKDTKSGEFGGIREMLNGYCRWQVETKWDGEPYRWNILHDNPNVDEKEKIEKEEIEGFKHIFTYYLI